MIPYRSYHTSNPESFQHFPTDEELRAYGYPAEGLPHEEAWCKAYKLWEQDHPDRSERASLYMRLRKQHLYSAALHLAAAATGEYEEALKDGRAEYRLMQELHHLGLGKKIVLRFKRLKEK